MDLLKCQGKQLFRVRGVSVPDGEHAAWVRETLEAAERVVELAR
jgi:succinyl-CoA synthetase beta subunit